MTYTHRSTMNKRQRKHIRTQMVVMEVSLAKRHTQPTYVVFRIDIRAMLEQRIHHLDVVIKTGPDQRGTVSLQQWQNANEITVGLQCLTAETTRLMNVMMLMRLSKSSRKKQANQTQVRFLMMGLMGRY